MKSKALGWAIRTIAVIALAAVPSALAQAPKQITLRGVMHDYTALSPVAGPWEVRGPWSITVNERSGKAEFSAALTMERSDSGVLYSGGGDLNNPMDRMAHTHHITMTGNVTRTANGYQLLGKATITKDGAFPPPFGPVLPWVTVQITGGNSVPFSNITVLFGDPASGHFGTAPLHGVVRGWEYADAPRR